MNQVIRIQYVDQISYIFLLWSKILLYQENNDGRLNKLFQITKQKITD